MSLIMELGLAHDVEKYRLRLVIVLESADFCVVELGQPGKQLVDFACLPVEAENRLAGAIAIVGAEILASVDDVFDDLFNRGKVSHHLRVRGVSRLPSAHERERERGKGRTGSTPCSLLDEAAGAGKAGTVDEFCGAMGGAGDIAIVEEGRGTIGNGLTGKKCMLARSKAPRSHAFRVPPTSYVVRARFRCEVVPLPLVKRKPQTIFRIISLATGASHS